MAFAARYKGTCARCGKPIVPGQLIHWNRKVRGSAWHHDCASPDAPAPTPSGMVVDFPAYVERTPYVAPSDGVSIALGDDGIAHIYKPQIVTDGKPKPLAKLRISDDWHVILPAVLPYSTRVLVIGPPGTGKSTTAINVAGIKHRITMTETTSREDLIGMFHLVDGATKWVDGPITAAMRNGEAVLTDEIDRYSPECASLFYGVIDDKPHIVLPNGEIIHAVDGYRMIMTSNEGLDTLPPAVQDRIELVLYAGTPHDAAVSHLPKANRAVVDLYYNGLPKPSLKLPPTVRRMRMFHKLTAAGMESRLAATLVFGKDGAAEVTSAITSAESTVCR